MNIKSIFNINRDLSMSEILEFTSLHKSWTNVAIEKWW